MQVYSRKSSTSDELKGSYISNIKKKSVENDKSNRDDLDLISTPESNNESKTKENSNTIDEFEFEYRTCFVIFLTLNAAIGSFFIGWSLSVFDTVQINIAEIFKWTDEEEKFYLSFISSTIPIGGVFGSFISGPILSKIGRKYTFILTDLVSLIAIGLTLILNEYSMIAGRFISGLCMGGYSSVVCIYVIEYVPYAISGTCGAIFECCFCFGVFASYLFGLNLPPVEDVNDQWWRVMVAFPALLTSLNTILLLTVFTEDTPKYLYMNKGDTKGTIKSLKKIYCREIDIQKMLDDYKELSTMQDEVGFKEMFNKKYRLRLFIVCVIMIAQQTCGIDALLMYSDRILLTHITDRKLATIFTNLIGFSQMISGIIAIYVLQRAGRKTLLTWGIFIMFLILSSISSCYYFECFTPIAYLFIFFTFINGLTLSPISYIYAADVLPENGVAIGMTFNNLSSFMVTQTFLYLISSSIDLQGTIFIYAVLTFIAFIITYFRVKETMGLSAREVEQLFDNKREESLLLNKNSDLNIEYIINT